MDLNQQAQSFMTTIQTRKRNPVSRNTVKTYQSLLDTWILPRLGSKTLKSIENGALRAFVASISGSLAPTSVNQATALVKAVIASAVDTNGNALYPRTWNPGFIDAPVIRKTDLKAPIMCPETLLQAICGAQRQEQALYSLLAGTGLRIGEALSLSAQIGSGSYWDARNRVIHVSSTLLLDTGEIQNHPKTEAGVREVDVHPSLNKILCSIVHPESKLVFTEHNRPLVYSTVRRHLHGLGIAEAPHAFRRFRATYLESQRVPRALIKYWMGHANSDITESYIKMGQDLSFRRQECERAGLGFELPQ
jgi:integrase